MSGLAADRGPTRQHDDDLLVVRLKVHKTSPLSNTQNRVRRAGCDSAELPTRLVARDNRRDGHAQFEPIAGRPNLGLPTAPKGAPDSFAFSFATSTEGVGRGPSCRP